MPSTLANFTEATTAPANDFIVGYDTAVLGGERRWTVATIANAVSGIMNQQLNNVFGTIISDNAPSGALEGQLWFDSSSGVTNVRYDGTWVDVGGGDSGTSAGSVNGIVQCDGNGNFSAADLETLINNLIMEPALTTLITTTVTNQVITNSPAVLKGFYVNYDNAITGRVAFQFYDGTTEILRGNTDDNGASNSAATFPIGGIDCPNGIRVTTSFTNTNIAHGLTVIYNLK